MEPKILGGLLFADYDYYLAACPIELGQDATGIATKPKVDRVGDDPFFFRTYTGAMDRDSLYREKKPVPRRPPFYHRIGTQRPSDFGPVLRAETPVHVLLDHTTAYRTNSYDR